jgi:hypothetical protein
VLSGGSVLPVEIRPPDLPFQHWIIRVGGQHVMGAKWTQVNLTTKVQQGFLGG